MTVMWYNSNNRWSEEFVLDSFYDLILCSIHSIMDPFGIYELVYEFFIRGLD